MHLTARHLDAGASGASFIRYALLIQYGHHVAGILWIEPTVEQHEIGTTGEKHHDRQRDGNNEAGGRHGEFLVHA